MCDRIAIISKGNLVALDTTQKLIDRIQTKKVIFKVEEFDINEKLSLKGIEFTINSKNMITAVYEKSLNKFDDILNLFKKKQFKILDIVTEDGDLEDVFVQLTKN